MNWGKITGTVLGLLAVVALGACVLALRFCVGYAVGWCSMCVVDLGADIESKVPAIMGLIFVVVPMLTSSSDQRWHVGEKMIVRGDARMLQTQEEKAVKMKERLFNEEYEAMEWLKKNLPLDSQGHFGSLQGWTREVQLSW